MQHFRKKTFLQNMTLYKTNNISEITTNIQKKFTQQDITRHFRPSETFNKMHQLLFCILKVCC